MLENEKNLYETNNAKVTRITSLYNLLKLSKFYNVEYCSWETFMTDALKKLGKHYLNFEAGM